MVQWPTTLWDIEHSGMLQCKLNVEEAIAADKERTEKANLHHLPIGLLELERTTPYTPIVLLPYSSKLAEAKMPLYSSTTSLKMGVPGRFGSSLLPSSVSRPTLISCIFCNFEMGFDAALGQGGYIQHLQVLYSIQKL